MISVILIESTIKIQNKTLILLITTIKIILFYYEKDVSLCVFINTRLRLFTE